MLSTEELHKIYLSCEQQVCTDTRKITKGCLFICLTGSNFDGNEFALKALELGAKAVLTSRESLAQESTIYNTQNTLKALQKLSTLHRSTFTYSVLGIGGSNGKTTTKEYCSIVANSSYTSYATPGNFNNHIGLPLSILNTPKACNAAIYEMGTNHPGEMQELSDICQAGIVLVTNIGKEHLEGFGSIEAIAKEESVLLDYALKNNKTAIINADDPWLGNMAKRLTNTISFGIENAADVNGIIHESMPFAKFSIKNNGKEYGPYQLQTGGEYNVLNALSAIAYGLLLKIDIDTAAKQCEKYIPENNRSQWLQKGKHTIWLDAYNANPTSVELTLKEFAKLSGSKTAILGDMFEMGDHALNEHLAIISLAKELGLAETYFCGEFYYEAAPNHPYVFKNKEDLASHFNKSQKWNDTILLKGSRGMKIETFLDVIV